MLGVYNMKSLAAPDGFAPPPPGLEPGILLLKYGAVIERKPASLLSCFGVSWSEKAGRSDAENAEEENG